MIRTDEKTASCPEAEHTAIPETPFSCNLAETRVSVSCAVTCHFGEMSSVTDARVVGKHAGGNVKALSCERCQLVSRRSSSH